MSNYISKIDCLEICQRLGVLGTVGFRAGIGSGLGWTKLWPSQPQFGLGWDRHGLS